MFEQALIRAIKQRDLKEGEGETLRKIAEALLERAIAADLTAIKETRDTLDGKPAIAVTGPDGGPVQIESIKRVIVDPSAKAFAPIPEIYGISSGPKP